MRLILLTLLLFVQFHTHAYADPVPAYTRSEFVTKGFPKCVDQFRENILNRGVTDSQLAQYCKCYVDRYTDNLMDKKTQMIYGTRDPTVFPKASNWDYSKIFKSAIDTEDGRVAYKKEYIRPLVSDCDPTSPTDGSIIYKLMSPATQTAMCNCEVNKAYELISIKKMIEVLQKSDATLVKRELTNAADTCSWDSKIIGDNERLMLSVAHDCQSKNSGKAADLVNSFCTCKGKRIAEKVASLDAFKKMEKKMQLAMVKEVEYFCSAPK
jgi:hypothetical protein